MSVEAPWIYMSHEGLARLYEARADDWRRQIAALAPDAAERAPMIVAARKCVGTVEALRKAGQASWVLVSTDWVFDMVP